MFSLKRFRLILNSGDNWQDIKDEHGCRLVIGEFHFTKREVDGFTASNECRDVLAAMEISGKLLLEEHGVHDSYSQISDSLKKLIKMTSSPGPDDGPINNNSFGRVNKKLFVFSLTCCLSSWLLIIGMYQSVYLKFHVILRNLNFSLQLLKILRYSFAAQVVPSLFSKSTHIEVSNALQHNQLILVSLAVSMNARSQVFYTENGKLGWPVPSLKQLFTTAVAYKKKFKKGIISSWEGYKDNSVSISIFFIFKCYI
jgi:hypothetical protein